MHAHAEGAPSAVRRSFLHRFEGGVLVVAFLLSMAIPLIDALGRPFHGFGVPGSSEYRAQLTLWLALLGGLLAARERHHLTLSTAEALVRLKPIGHAEELASALDDWAFFGDPATGKALQARARRIRERIARPGG